MILATFLALATVGAPSDDPRTRELQARFGKPTIPSYTEHADADHRGVDLAETRLLLLGGFGGERVSMKSMAMVWTLGRTKIYARKGDYRPLTQRHLYADRDGDGFVDAGAFYNPKTGMVLADWNCDGVGDQILAHVR
jgi:hypothetical protein